MDPEENQSSSSTSDQEEDFNTNEHNEETPNESQTNSSTTDEHQVENPSLSPRNPEEESSSESETSPESKEEEEKDALLSSPEQQENETSPESKEEEEKEEVALLSSPEQQQDETSPVSKEEEEEKEEKNEKEEEDALLSSQDQQQDETSPESKEKEEKEEDALLSSPDRQEEDETDPKESLEQNPTIKSETNENDESTNETNERKESTEDEQREEKNEEIVVINKTDDDDPFHLPSRTDFQTSEEIKSQRVLDEEEIPPATPTVLLLQSSSSRKNSFSNEKRLSQSSQPLIFTNDDEEKENDDPKKNPDQIDSTEEKEIDVEQSILPPLESTSIAQELIHDQQIHPEDLLEEKKIVVEEETTSNEQIEYPWEDILSNHSLMKQIIRKGRTNSRPSRSQLVKVNYSLSTIDKETSEEKLIEEMFNEEFFVGELDIILAIDYSVQSMEEGEIALIHSDLRHCSGKEEIIEKDLQNGKEIKDYQIKIQLELLQYLPAPNVELLSAAERSLWAEKKRQNGNNFYRRKDYSSSLQCYRGSLRFLDLENNPLRTETNDEDRKKLVDQYIQVQNNVAQVNLNLKRYDLCLNAVENVLKIDPKNSKALFRQGKSFFELGQYEQCRIPLKYLLQLEPTNPDKDQILSIISTADQKLADYQKNEKEIYRRMFHPSASPTSSSTTTTTNSSKTKTRRNLVLKKSNSSSNFLPYLCLAGVAFGAIGLFTFFKYRKTS